MSGVFYRSDTRDPATIFTKGFDKRDSQYGDPALRWFKDKRTGNRLKKAPDVVPQSAVCFTRHFQAAPIFPVGDLDTDSWVYVMELDTSDIFNTQCKQWEDVVDRDLLNSASDSEAETALWPMFGQERAMNSIPGDRIIGAVRVKRKFNKPGSFKQGGSFICESYMANSGFRDAEGSAASLATKMIGDLVSSKEALKMPTLLSGFHKSTGK